MCQATSVVELRARSPRAEVPVPQAHGPDASRMLGDGKRQAPLGQDAEARWEEGAGIGGPGKRSHSFISGGQIQIPCRFGPRRISGGMLMATR